MCVIGLERIISDVNDEPFDDLSAPAVQTKITLAKMYYQRFHEHMVAPAGQISAQAIISKTKRMNSVDKMYDTLTAALYQRLDELKANETNASIANSASLPRQIVPNASDVRAKKLEIEPFAGDVRKWPQFKSMFQECFHSRDEYANTVKFYHLMSHLVPDSEAYKTISALDRTDENYPSAWKKLCDAYDTKGKS